MFARRVSLPESMSLAIYFVVGIVVFLRLFQLDSLPGDLYGDIAIVLTYVASIFDGNWPTSFQLSAGPLYHYLIAPLLWLTGLNYNGAKLASVLVSLVTLACTYGLGRDLVNKQVGLLACFATGVSCWFLVFSRLGNSQILVPLLAVASVYTALRGVQRRSPGNIVGSAIIAAGGLYTYPQSFILPAVTGLVVICLIRQHERPWSAFGLYAITTAICALPFMAIAYRDLQTFVSGYIGNKLPSDTEWGRVLGQNVWNTMLSLHVRGDATFRSNPQALPQLDAVSGGCFLIGLIFWLLPTHRKYAPVLLVPLVLLHLPAMLVRYTNEVPSASRALGAVPFIFIIVAGGLWWLLEWLRRWPIMQYVVVVALCGAMLAINSYRYFVLYADGLPNHNVAFGRVITTYIDQLPPERSVVVVGCCWGEMGQPHPAAIRYDLQLPRKLYLMRTDQATCDQLMLIPRPATLIWGLNAGLPVPDLAACLNDLPITLHLAPEGEPVFQSTDLSP